MARKLLQLLLFILTASGALSYLSFNVILSDIEQNEHANQKILLNDISTQINLAYELLDKLLIQKQQSYRDLHQFALSLILEADGQPDLSLLQKTLEKKSGFPIDLYIIDKDLKISDTTFIPDLGLDFKLPSFLDVQKFLSKARQTNQIMVGQPNMELISKKFKIYTYSVLGDNRYLELGLIDPDINGYFQRLIRYITDRGDARISIFIEYWNKILSPLTLTPESTTSNKLTQLEQNEINTQKDRQAFRHVNSSNLPYQTQTTDDQGRETTSYYIQVPALSGAIIDELSVRLLAKITFDDEKLRTIKENFRLFLWLSVLLTLFGMLYFAFYIQHWLIMPLNLLLSSIRNKLPVKIQALSSGSYEIREIATTYNNTLDHLKQSMSELEQQSSIDPLTKLYNRRKFIHSFEREISRARRNHSMLALAMLDVDNFKEHNDRYGHQQGDQLLIELARQMKKHFRRPSDHLCRMGGDEFSILLVDIQPSLIISVFENLQHDWTLQYQNSVPQTHKAEPLSVSISIGIYVFESSLTSTWETAYQQADTALYKAKNMGRNLIVVADTPQQSHSTEGK